MLLKIRDSLKNLENKLINNFISSQIQSYRKVNKLILGEGGEYLDSPFIIDSQL